MTIGAFIDRNGLVRYSPHNSARLYPPAGECEICGQPTSVLDHCPEHGWIRGQACTGCNVRLGAIDSGSSPFGANRIPDTFTQHLLKCPDCPREFILTDKAKPFRFTRSGRLNECTCRRIYYGANAQCPRCDPACKKWRTSETGVTVRIRD